MRMDRRLMQAIAAVGLAMAVWLGLTFALIWSTLEAGQRNALGEMLWPRLVLVAMSWFIALALVTAGLRVLYRRFASAPLRLLEQTRVLLAAAEPQKLETGGTGENRALGEAINELAAQRDHLRADMAEQIAQASRSVQQEKNRLAALMAELTQSVVVCNLDGRILLYNSRARLQFRAMSQAPALADGAELIGIGRSIYAVFDRPVAACANGAGARGGGGRGRTS